MVQVDHPNLFLGPQISPSVFPIFPLAKQCRVCVENRLSAASTIAKLLQKKGGTLMAAPEGFLVTGEEGPLKDGELERAANWVQALTKNIALEV